MAVDERPAMNRMLLGYSPDFDLFEEEASMVAIAPEHEASLQSSDHTEAATELLEVAGRPALPSLLTRLLRRAAHTVAPTLDRAVEGELLRLLQRAARIALPTRSIASRDTATQASRFFGIELEGLSPEDQEFESARRFIQLVEAAAQHAAAGSQRLPPAVAAWLAVSRAAKRFAPGWAAAQHAPPHRSARIAARGSRPATFQGAHHA
jgi:hypothetical protein